MQPVAYLTLFLVAASAVASASQSAEQAANTNSVSGQPQGVVVSNSPNGVQTQPQQVGNAPVVEVGQQQQPSNVVVETHHPVHGHPAPVAYYGAAGVVGAEQQVGVTGNKPQQVVAGVVPRNYEQYGQPESAGLPPNYKPFGSWGLYIGGNPADGYYTNYYKALSNSVGDKPQPVVGEQPAGVVKPVVSQTAALSPVLRQASSSPYVGSDYYPFATYSPSDLNSAARVVVDPVAGHGSPVPALSPVQAGAQVYGSPAAFESNYGVSPYADAYATKKVGAAYATKEVTKEVPVVQQPAKGYQSRVYVYPTQASPSVYGPQQPQQVAHQQVGHNQVVAYPVPVGSQIVGSQAGIDGAFAPYGVHAFTRYAVKPTVVNQEPSYYYSVQQPSTYKQQSQQHHHQQPQQVYQPSVGSSYYPFSYYGYPLNQLHYSQGAPFPGVEAAGVIQPKFDSNVQPPQFDGVVVSDKVENEKVKQERKA